MGSVFDDVRFNQRLFFPRADRSPCPPGARDLRLPVASSVTLHARHHPAPRHRATVLLFHGNGEVVADYDDVARSFHDLDASLVVIDFRGYGASDGAPTLRTALADAVPATLAARALTPGPHVLFGRSLGGACAAEVAGQVPPVVDGVVLESAGSDLDSLLRRRGMTRERPWSDDELRTFAPLPKLARCPLPALVLHGEADQAISIAEAEASFGALGSARKTLVRVPGRGHNDVSASNVYWQALAAFLRSLA